MTPEQREQFCERHEVIVGPIYDDNGKPRGWYAYTPQKMIQHSATTRAEAIEGLARHIIEPENKSQK